MNAPAVRVATPEDLDRQALERVAFDEHPVVVEPALLDAVDGRRAAMLAALDGQRVYGVTTGMGFLSTVDLDAAAQETHQQRLLLGRAVGSAPYLPRGEARAVLVVRLAEFLRGHAGVSAALCRFLADRLNDGFVPAIPAHGVGTAGEVLPLAHAFQTFLGVGVVLDADGAPADAAAALRARGVEPYRPGEKEGVALLAGAPAAAALSASRRRCERRLRAQLTVGVAAAIDALGAPRGPLDPVLAELARDPCLDVVLADLRALAGAPGPGAAGAAPGGPEAGAAGHQAPVSFRVAPQVLAHLARTAARLAEDTDRALAAVTDSPVFADGRFVTSGAFHAIDLAAGMDHLAAALVRAGELALQRVHRLLDERFSGLPPQLTPAGGTGSGLVAVHKRGVGAVNELRRLAAPASVGLADTSLGQEDAQTFTFEAAAKLRRVEALVGDVLACELLCARQAWWLGDRRPAPGLAEVAVTLNALVPPIAQDRPLGEDLDRLRALLEGGGLVDELDRADDPCAAR
jgi:histidine ammonia-lyase